MIGRAVLTALAVLPMAARADGPITGAEAFERATRGRTFFYTRGGTSYGAEQYLPGRRVIWAFSGDDCLKGYWFANADAICFVYEDRPEETQCWTFRQTEAGLEGRVVGDDQTPPLIARRSSPEPMACLGPDIGV